MPRPGPPPRRPARQSLRQTRRPAGRPQAGSARQRRAGGRRGHLRGTPTTRLRWGFLAIAFVLTAFMGRLVQLQALDPQSYAALAAAEGTETVRSEEHTSELQSNAPIWV